MKRTIENPEHSQDMNFHVFEDKVEYLVDLQDVIDWKYEQEEFASEDEDGMGASTEDCRKFIEYQEENGNSQWYWKKR